MLKCFTSIRNCLHGPHGEMKSVSRSLVIAMALNFVWPSDTALEMAVISAQMEQNAAFSTLQPGRVTHLFRYSKRVISLWPEMRHQREGGGCGTTKTMDPESAGTRWDSDYWY